MKVLRMIMISIFLLCVTAAGVYAADGGKIGLVDPDALLGRVGDLLTRQTRHTQEERE